MEAKKVAESDELTAFYGDDKLDASKAAIASQMESKKILGEGSDESNDDAILAMMAKTNPAEAARLRVRRKAEDSPSSRKRAPDHLAKLPLRAFNTLSAPAYFASPVRRSRQRARRWAVALQAPRRYPWRQRRAWMW